MDPVSIGALITTLIPVLTTGIKKLFKTDKLDKELSKGVNTLIPIVLGVLSTGIYALSQGANWKLALAIGLGSGMAAQNMRNLNKRFNIISALVSKKK